MGFRVQRLLSCLTDNGGVEKEIDTAIFFRLRVQGFVLVWNGGVDLQSM